jgi:low affinity Fe/Cu permease
MHIFFLSLPVYFGVTQLMLDKKISVGTIITVFTIVGTCIYTQGIMTNKIDSIEVASEKNSNSIYKVKDEVNENKVNIGKIEAKIDEGFKRLETLLIEN